MTSKRTASAALLLGLSFVTLAFAPLRLYVFPVLVLGFGALCMHELVELMRLRSLRVSYALCLTGVAILAADGRLAGLRHAGPILALSVVVLLTLRVLESTFENVASEVGSTLLAIAYIGLPMGMATALVQMVTVDGTPIGVFHIVFLVVVVFGGDIAAYFVGRRWGRTRFFPRLSPKKTLEGAVASVVVSLALALVLTGVVGPIRACYGLRHGLILGVLLGFMSPLGDLAESCFKRDAKRKDSGHDLTGHGGFLDIFDAIFFGLPIQFCYVQLVLANL